MDLLLSDFMLSIVLGQPPENVAELAGDAARVFSHRKSEHTILGPVMAIGAAWLQLAAHKITAITNTTFFRFSL